MTVSVIIPTYNEAKYIKNCLESLGKQSLLPQEIIVVDDGSTDRTVEIIKGITFSISKRGKGNTLLIKVFAQSHLGAGAARNRGAQEATGDILVFVDADMEFDKDFLKNLTAPIRTGKTKGTFSKDEFIKNWDNPWARSWNYCVGLKTNRAIPENYPNQSPVFRAILKSEFDKVNGFDANRGYDDDWSLSEKLGYKATQASRATYYHCNPDSIGEIFRQARWKANRKYKLNRVGQILNLIKTLVLLTFSPWFKLFCYFQPQVFLAKIAYDAGILIGLLTNIATGKTNK